MGRCGVVWCGMVWCGVVWYGVVWYGMVWYGMVWCGGPFSRQFGSLCPPKRAAVIEIGNEIKWATQLFEHPQWSRIISENQAISAIFDPFCALQWSYFNFFPEYFVCPDRSAWAQKVSGEGVFMGSKHLFGPSGLGTTSYSTCIGPTLDPSGPYELGIVCSLTGVKWRRGPGIT